MRTSTSIWIGRHDRIEVRTERRESLACVEVSIGDNVRLVFETGTERRTLDTRDQLAALRDGLADAVERIDAAFERGGDDDAT